MTLLTPLGLLGLLGIVALIIIYIIKPNYQQKLISSTFVWKLSLKYRKKKIPINKLRNFLIILCQILILTAASMILAKPVEVLKHKVESREVIAIIDSSASMRTEYGSESRFERAVLGVQDLSKSVFDEDGTVSVILADSTPAFIAERFTDDNRATLLDDLDALVYDDACSYGVSDIENAILLCETLLEENPDAEVHLYTDVNYSYIPEKVNVVNVSEKGEWNAAILDAYTILEDNFYTFYVDVACYGRDRNITVNVSVKGANAEGEDAGVSRDFSCDVLCSREKTKRVVFINSDLYQEIEGESEDIVYYPLDSNERVFAYKEVYIYITENDSFREDNDFSIFDGSKEVVKLLYASEDPNPFFPAVMQNLRGIWANKWEFWITEVKPGDEPPDGGYSGYDFYFFEHTMPEKVPTDGIVFLSNPDIAPVGSDILRIEGQYHWNGKSSPVEMAEEKHPLLNYMNVSNMALSMYTRVTYGPSYTPLLTCDNGMPVLAVCDEPDKKIVVMNFSVHFTTMAITENISILLYNVFEYFMPSTVNGNAFEVNEKISLNARGLELFASRDGSTDEPLIFNSFPATMDLNLPGAYILSQTTFSGKPVEEKIYVKIPSAESNIRATEDALGNPYKDQDETEYYNDLMLYIAAAMVAILFLEWWLQSRENA